MTGTAFTITPNVNKTYYIKVRVKRVIRTENKAKLCYGKWSKTKKVENYTKAGRAAKNKQASISKVSNPKGKKVKVSVKKAKGYKFQYQISTSKKFSKASSVKTSKTACTFTKQKKGTTYYIRVRTYKTADKVTVYGKWSKVMKIKVNK